MDIIYYQIYVSRTIFFCLKQKTHQNFLKSFFFVLGRFKSSFLIFFNIFEQKILEIRNAEKLYSSIGHENENEAESVAYTVLKLLPKTRMW